MTKHRFAVERRKITTRPRTRAIPWRPEQSAPPERPRRPIEGAPTLRGQRWADFDQHPEDEGNDDVR